ncbi:MAG: TonB-dependent siderophore receptor [Sphingobium sp.]
MTVTDTAIDEAPGGGYKVEKADSPKYTAPLLDTPKTIIVMPAQVIQETGSISLADALRTVPGITFGAGEGGNPQGDRPFIRGFDAQGSTYVDGIRSVGGQSREVFAVEQIEVVKGGDSTMGGRGSAGGSLNLVSKMPHLGNSAQLDLGMGSSDYKRATLDVNYQLSDVAAIRLNGMWYDGDVAGRDVVTNNRWGISPSIAFGLGTPTRASLNYYHLESDDIPDPGIPFALTAAQAATAGVRNIGPANVPGNTFYGLANRDFRTTNVDEVLARVEHDLSDTLRVRNTLKFANVQQAYIITQPDDSQGNVLAGRVWRRANTRYASVSSMIDQLDLTGTFNTGSIKHSFSIGAEGAWEQSKRGTFNNVSTNVVAGSPAAQRCGTANIAAYNCTTLINPNPYDPWTNIQAGGTVGVPITKSGITGITEANTYSIYAMDTITVIPELLINLGARYDWYDTRSKASASPDWTSLSYKDQFFNGQAGITFKPVPNGSIYVSFATSATPPGSLIGEGQEGNAIAATTLNDLRPEETKSYEIGTKWEFFDAALGLSLALFRTDTDNARTTGATGLLEYVGTRKIEGVEVGFNGKPLPFWSVFGGYTYMDSKISNAGPGSASNGQPFPNTPKHSFTGWSTFDIGERFQIGGGAIYNSRQYGSPASATITRSIPGYWRFDGTASAKINDRVSLRVNVQNIFDKRYYDRTYTTHFVGIAPGRSAFATLSLKY